MPYYGIERTPELDFRGVYRVEEDGSGLTLLADDFAQPNGLCFSINEKRLFINDTERGHIRVFDVGIDGLLSNGAVWAEVKGTGNGAPDGMKVDRDGNLYCCGPDGLHVFSSRARSLGVIRVPEVVANFAWGDDDLLSIFLTASTSLYRVRTKTPGIALF
jgi:gluconolactonase